MTPSKHQFDGKKVKVKLADVCTLTMGQSPSSNSYNEIGNGIPFFQGNADFGEEAPVPRVWCTDPKKTAEGGDLLISVRAPIGAVNMAVERCCIGRGVAAIHPNDDSISVDFLKHQLLSKRRELETMGTGSTFKAVGKKSLGNLTLVLYPEDTQHEIERCLNQIKKQIKAISSQSSKLDSLVKSRFIEMFGDPFDNEKEWPEYALGSLLKIARGGSPRPIKKYITDDPEGINWIKIGDAVSGSRYIFGTAEKIKPSGTKKSRLVHSGDFLLSNSMSFGKPYILKTDGCIHDGWLVLQGVEQHFDSLFLYQLLASEGLLRKFNSLVRGGVVSNLNKDLVGSVSVMVPQIALQREFADFVKKVDKSRFAMLSGALKTLYARLMESLA